jgi:diguanylate cyclase (GGDEF)-like protein
LIFVQSVVVAVLCRPESAPLLDAHATETAHSTSLLPAAWFCFAIAGVVLLVRFVLLRKPAESALFWALLAVLLALYHGGGGRISMAYFAAAVGILAIAIVETSYLLAYHDELTALPARRAFNAALERLEEPYSIAMVDIDHFKRFNDTHGHDVGDQVLQLVASKLARVSGDGQAYRCGGEEFAILFPRKTTAEVLEHLEQLRMAIESAVFRTRGGDRRQVSRGPDRRRQRSPRARRPSPIQAPRGLSVTVSIGVAASSKARSHPDQVIEAADKALYRAKAAGRNRVESAASSGRKIRQKATGIA